MIIDIRKPLEGAPGLLLLAALVLFGATIGVSLALIFSWVEMKDSLANFLGGVVGAGLGAGLAVFGAVYIQRRERRDALVPAATELIIRLEELQRDTFTLTIALENPSPDNLQYSVQYQRYIAVASGMRERYRSLPFMFDLGQDINTKLERLKMDGQITMEAIRQDLTDPSLSPEVQHQRSGRAARLLVAKMDELLSFLGKSFGVRTTTFADQLIGLRPTDAKSGP
ncbi:hypothetical protein SAMN02745126_04339 [Enhydrobacter aerosaccus]|uniref:5-bromo-4-chloroindolyl phosphate hydrolysis protein n=1 Tax=Enhydrobacter aerosaccus TaxID=225324 RepID=A0A1T4S759_9HYPH|nr:hypothetical protein [Enhydrobacter aerosaccus]SKA23738.1 hypothetical protein SAMN02745126_04339 [Enhydrobacter aerosaccus]